jgi:hypothetical protein
VPAGQRPDRACVALLGSKARKAPRYLARSARRHRLAQWPFPAILATSGHDAEVMMPMIPAGGGQTVAGPLVGNAEGVAGSRLVRASPPRWRDGSGVTGAVSWTGEAAPRTGASEPVTVPFLGTSQGPLVASSTPRAATGGVIPDTPGVTVGGTPAPSCKPAPSPPTPSLPTAAATMKDATAADGWSAGTPTQPVTFDEQRARLVVRGQGGHQPVDDHGDLPVVATDYSPVADTPSLIVTAATEKRATPDRTIVTSTASRPHIASRGQIAGSALTFRAGRAADGRHSGRFASSRSG